MTDSELPRAPANMMTERAGILAVATELNRLGIIWRETPMADVGIDGQLELVDDDGKATGQVLAAQVKSGASYFRDGGDAWHFYPAPKHRLYWERFPLPVLLFLHSPDSGLTHWTDVRRALRELKRSASAPVLVPKANVLQAASRRTFAEAIGGSLQRLDTLDEVLVTLAASASPNRCFPISYLDLFTAGLINLSRSIFYGMDVVETIVSFLLDAAGSEEDLSLWPSDHEFLFGYVRFLVEQNLAEVNFEDCLVDWIERELQPIFIAPLTRRGRGLVQLIKAREKEYRTRGLLDLPPGVNTTAEGLVRMELRDSFMGKLEGTRQFRVALIRDTAGSGADPVAE